MKPFKTAEQLPEKCIADGSEEVWWWDNHNDSWTLGIAIFLDFDDEAILERYTHWLPENAIIHPTEE